MSDALEIAINIFADNSSARTALEGVGTAARKSGQEVESSSKRMRNELGQFVPKAKEVEKSIDDIGKSNGFKEAEGKAKSFFDSLHEARRATEGVRETIGEIRNVGIGLGAAGIGGLMLSNSWQKAAEEGEGIEQRLESILNQQKRVNDLGGINESVQKVTVEGHFADDDEIRNAAVLLASFNTQTKDMGSLLEWSARQARTMGVEVDGVAEALGKAYNTGQVSALKRSGVTIDDADIEKIKEAYEISKELGQQKFVEIIGPAILDNTAALKDSLTEAQAAINDAKRTFDDAQTALGRGAQSAKANVDGLLASVITTFSQSPKVLEEAGAIEYYGSVLLAGVGSVVTFGGALGEAMIGWRAYTAASSAATIATDLSTIALSGEAVAATTSTGATTAAGVAAGGAAIGFGALAAAAALAAIAVAGVWVAIAGSKDAGTMTDEKLKEKWGPLGDFWVWASGSDQTNPETGDNMDGGGPSESPEEKAKRDANQAIANMKSALSDGAAQASPTMQSVMNLSLAADTTATDSQALIDDLEDQIAATTSKSQKKALQNQLRLAKRAAQDQKALDKSTEKLRKANESLLDKKADAESEILIAQIEADTELQIKRIEALKTDDNEKETRLKAAKLRADAIRKKAALQAKALTAGATDAEDKVAADKLLKLAQIEADKTERLAAIDGPETSSSSGKKNNFQLNDALAFLRRGGTIFDYKQSQNENGKSAASRRAGSGGNAPTTPRQLEVQAKTSVSQNALGQYILKILVPDTIVPSELGSALGGLN